MSEIPNEADPWADERIAADRILENLERARDEFFNLITGWQREITRWQRDEIDQLVPADRILENLERCCELVVISQDVLAEKSDAITDKDWTNITKVRRRLDRRLRAFDDMSEPPHEPTEV